MFKIFLKICETNVTYPTNFFQRKNTMLKKLLAAVLTSIACLSCAVTANSEELSTSSTFEYHGYNCYKKDGYNWTNIDGIEYLVIDIGDYIDGAVEATATNSRASIGKPANWTNSTTVDLTTSGTSHTDNCDISSKDYCSPVYKVTPTLGDLRFEIKTGLWLSNSYTVDIYYHLSSSIDSWHSEPDINLTFSLVVPKHIILTGTATSVTDAFAIRFLNSSTGQKKFEYTVTSI